MTQHGEKYGESNIMLYGQDRQKSYCVMQHVRGPLDQNDYYWDLQMHRFT